MYLVSHTEVTRSLSEPQAFLREAPVCKKLTQKLVPIRPKKITQTCWCHVMTPCQVSWFSGVFWIYMKLKTKFLNLFGRATTPRCLIFIPISCMGPRNSPKDTSYFSTNFGALEHVLVVQIWIMHIKCPETQLMHKNAKRTRNNSKFKHDTHVLIAC